MKYLLEHDFEVDVSLQKIEIKLNSSNYKNNTTNSFLNNFSNYLIDTNMVKF
jgi:hypothetical protein